MLIASFRSWLEMNLVVMLVVLAWTFHQAKKFASMNPKMAGGLARIIGALILRKLR